MKVKLRRNLLGEVQERILDSLESGKNMSVGRLIKDGDELNDICILFTSLARLYSKGLIHVDCRAAKRMDKILTDVGYFGFEFDGRFKNAFENRTKIFEILKRSTKPLGVTEINERLAYAGVKIKTNTLSKNLAELVSRGILKHVGYNRNSVYTIATRKLVLRDKYESDVRARIVNVLKKCELPVRSKYILEELNNKIKIGYLKFIKILVNMESDLIVERSGFSCNIKWKLKE